MDHPAVRLESHPHARSQAVAAIPLRAGATIVTVSALSTVLVDSEKGRRCDTCLSIATLRKCSGCASYWYCGTTCQTNQWKAHHKKLCSKINRYTASPEYQALASHEKLDAFLLTHVVAEFYGSKAPEDHKGLETLLSLLPGPNTNASVLQTCVSTSPETLHELYSRFSNNNFAVHSHLASIAHGIFPLASRLFNHSCVPNAAAKYIMVPGHPVRMEVVALRNIAVGEEICIPYLDPAMLQSRKQIFELTYGFTCSCPSCELLKHLGPIPEASTELPARQAMEQQLAQFVFPTGISSARLSEIHEDLEAFPHSILPMVQESYLTSLSDNFSAASHDGPYDAALATGETILALYALIYPPNYPQVGMHLLEMAKTAWNAVVTGTGIEQDMLARTELYLECSREILLILGREGDKGGPLDEIETLSRLIKE